MKLTANVTVAGSVQGVMYRSFVKDCAGLCGITGTVRNLTDGKVEIIAQGSEEGIKKFAEEIKRAPLPAKVEDVWLSWLKTIGEMSDFKIIF